MFSPVVYVCMDKIKEKRGKALLTDGLDKGVQIFRVTARGGTWGNVGGADQIHNENDAFFVLRIVKGTMHFGIVKPNGPVVGFKDTSIDPRPIQTGDCGTHQWNVNPHHMIGQVRPTHMHSQGRFRIQKKSSHLLMV
eukprot:scaffold52233_cov41-Attheya_sp.AAC.2